MTQEQWYSNKELFEMFSDQVNGLKDDIVGLRADLRETQQIVRQYNGLRQRLDDVEARVLTMEQQRLGRAGVADAVLRWGGWIVAILGILASYIAILAR